MKEKPKKSIRAWVAREKNGALFLFCEKPKIRIAQYDNQKKLFKQYTHKYQ